MVLKICEMLVLMDTPKVVLLEEEEEGKSLVSTKKEDRIGGNHLYVPMALFRKGMPSCNRTAPFQIGPDSSAV